MILYGSGDPLEALATWAPHVITVHAKDGTWPAAPGKLGSETALGDGRRRYPGIPRQTPRFRISKTGFHLSGKQAIRQPG